MRPCEKQVMNENIEKPTTSKVADSKSSGGGWSQMRSTTAFRALNFELYMKPNKVVWIPGAILFSGCIGYIIYMRAQHERNKTYTALNEDGSLTTRVRTSRWD